MTISSETNRASYAGSGTTGPFALPAALVGTNEAYVSATKVVDATGVETALTLTTDFTIDSGVTELTTVANVASGETLVITIGIAKTQGTDYIANDPFPAETHEAALDKLTLICQELDEKADRAIALGVTSSITGVTIPDPGADQYLKWNSAGTNLETFALSTTAGLGNVVDDTTPQLGGDLDMNGNQITSPDGTDLIDIPNGSIDLQTNSTSRLDISDTGVRLGAANARVTTILDEDAMTSNSATALATQQSIKAYVDSVGGGNLSNVVEDTTPQLGGDLDLNGNKLTSPDGTDLFYIPNGTIHLQTNSQSRMDITDSGVRLGATNARVTTILDEDTMATNSATALATQQSIKAYVDANAGSLTEGTSQATTSGTSIDFTSIPSGTKRIVITFDQVSLSGTDDMLVQIGDSGGIETTGYTSVAQQLAAAGVTSSSRTTGYGILTDAASDAIAGHIILTRLNSSSFTWLASGTFRVKSGTTLGVTGGHKTLSAELDRVRLTSLAGSDTFDAGNINIAYE